jgi:ketosteroid isomerase-like protein
LFHVGDLDGAFRSLRDHVGGGVRASSATPAAHVTAWARFRSTLPAGDWHGFASALRPDLIHMDRRSGLHSVITGRDEYVRVMSDSFGRRARDYDIEIVTTRGEAGVIRSTFFGPADDLGGPWETARVVFYVLGDDGRFVRFELFDIEHLDAAITALREHSGGSAGDLVERFIAAYNARDWSELEAVLDPDFELDDHRAIGWGESKGVDEFFVRIQAGLGASRDARVSIASWLRRADDLVLFDMPMRGHVVDVGGDFELDRLVLVRAADGRIRRMELFDAQDHESALSRFEELAVSPP